MLVNGCIVHQNYDVFVLSFLVDAELVQNSVQEIVKHDSVGSPLSYLSS